MDSVYKQQFMMLKKHLGIKSVISIRFSNIKEASFIQYQDTVCTALARSLKKNLLTYIDRGKGQPCQGGNYFLRISHPPTTEICNVYVKSEQVFQSNAICRSFLKELPKYPALARKKYILLTPLIKEKHRPDVILFLATPAQAGRILGLSVYQKFSHPVIVPAIPTCASIYASIEAQAVHVNFVDYYDRYFQGKRAGRLFWKDSELIISMPFSIFRQIMKWISLSAHGSNQPTTAPLKVDPL